MSEKKNKVLSQTSVPVTTEETPESKTEPSKSSEKTPEKTSPAPSETPAKTEPQVIRVCDDCGNKVVNPKTNRCLLCGGNWKD